MKLKSYTGIFFSGFLYFSFRLFTVDNDSFIFFFINANIYWCAHRLVLSFKQRGGFPVPQVEGPYGRPLAGSPPKLHCYRVRKVPAYFMVP